MATKQFYGKEEERFHAFLNKLHERLYIILKDNISKGVDPVETDVDLLNVLYRVYDSESISWLKDDVLDAQIVSEQQLFSDTTAEETKRSDS
jgi:CRP-like cAMP-binding protein